MATDEGTQITEAQPELPKGTSGGWTRTDPEQADLKLSHAQRGIILQYAELPSRLAERLSSQLAEETVTLLTLDDWDDLLDEVKFVVCRATGSEKQKLLRIIGKMEVLLGSRIDPADILKTRRPKQAPAAYQIKMSLLNIYPLIWRRIQTKDCTLEQLHALIQVTMGWEWDHAYSFTIGGVEFANVEMPFDGEIQDDSTTKLSDVLPIQNRRPRLKYTYDFGDDWVHQLIVEKRFKPEPGVTYPVCVGGERACPPEDCGGPWRYDDMVAASRDPAHWKHEECLDRLGEEFDPEKFDLNAVNEELRHLRFR